ncbi:hypothetical protein [Nocardioides sp. GXZ039]|uniref:hypothetical protein n=1 Tax=Nocardioides sp. GXZ039 TaxID=3136018 RepID=UPI0030F492C4
MSQIEIRMSAIYHAAHVALPAEASSFKSNADRITGAIEPIAAQVALAGNHPIGTDHADISVELFTHLRAMVRTFNDSATALDAIADDFVAVDGSAGAWFAHHQQYVGDPDIVDDPDTPELS